MAVLNLRFGTLGATGHPPLALPRRLPLHDLVQVGVNDLVDEEVDVDVVLVVAEGRGELFAGGEAEGERRESVQGR